MQRMDVESKQTQVHPAAEDNARPVTSPHAPDKDERLDFLKQAISFTRMDNPLVRYQGSNLNRRLRAGDKSVVVDAYIGLSEGGLETMLVVVLLGLFLTTVLLFGYVIWPVTLAQVRLIGSWQAKGLFYVADPTQLTANLYAHRLKDLVIEDELAAETLKLAYIREIKSRRFKKALIAVVVFYSWVGVTFLLLRNCTAG